MDSDAAFLYSGLEPVARVVFIAATGFVTLLLLLRVSGQRTLAQMSALDLVITVTLGSAFGRVITARDVALAQVVAAFVGADPAAMARCEAVGTDAGATTARGRRSDAAVFRR